MIEKTKNLQKKSIANYLFCWVSKTTTLLGFSALSLSSRLLSFGSAISVGVAISFD